MAGDRAPRLVAGRPRTDAQVAACIPVHQGGDHVAETLRSVSAADARAQRAFVTSLAREPGARAVDRLVGRVDAPLARLRREAVYALSLWRARRRGAAAGRPQT